MKRDNPYHRIPVVFISKEGMRKDEFGWTQNLFAIFKGYRCGAVDKDAQWKPRILATV
jgi:hypothetical protein